MATPKLPQNQLASLPLLTAEAVSAPGDIQIIGSTITRYFSPGDTGINLTAWTTPNPRIGANSMLISNFLDVRGTAGVFQILMVRRALLAAGDASTGIGMRIQYRTPAGGVLPQPILAHWAAMGVGLNIGVMGDATPFDAVAGSGFGVNNTQATGTAAAIVGNDVRLWFDAVTNVSLTAANSLWSVHMWASAL